jgi:hypothetical protein
VARLWAHDGRTVPMSDGRAVASQASQGG